MTCKYCCITNTMIIDVTGENDKLELCNYHAQKLAKEILNGLWEWIRDNES